MYLFLKQLISGVTPPHQGHPVPRARCRRPRGAEGSGSTRRGVGTARPSFGVSEPLRAGHSAFASGQRATPAADPAFDVFAADASPQTVRIKRCPRTSPGQWAGSVGVAGPTSCAGHPRLPRTRHFLRGAPQAPAHFLRASRPGGSGTESPCTAGCEPGAASARGHPHSFPARPSTPTASGGDPPSGKSPRQEGAWSWSRLT